VGPPSRHRLDLGGEVHLGWTIRSSDHQCMAKTILCVGRLRPAAQDRRLPFRHRRLDAAVESGPTLRLNLPCRALPDLQLRAKSKPLGRDVGVPTFGRNRFSSRGDMARNCHAVACSRVHGTRNIQFQHGVSLTGGTRVENRVPRKPMCRQVLTAHACRALLSCCRPFSIFSGPAAVGRAHCPCTSGASPTCRSDDRRVFASSTNGVSRGGRSSVAVALSRRDSRTTKRV
jgi:hypothetical protein